MSRIIWPAVVLAAIASLALGAAATEPATLKIGSLAPDFRLPGVDGKTYALDDFRDADVLVIVFTCNHCPTAQAYEDRLKQLAADYKDRKVALVAISPNDPLAVRPDELGYSDLGDSFEDMKIRAKDKAFNFPYLYDGADQKTAQAYGPVATPHVFIFDRERRLRYVGRIDDSDRASRATSPDARNALDALLAGKPVPVEKTKAFGCSIKWAGKREAAKKAQEAAAAEAVTLVPLDEPGLRALAGGDARNLRLLYAWAPGRDGGEDALPDIALMMPMYRRRGFDLATVAAASPEEKDKVLAALKEKHVAGANYLFGGGRDALLKAVDEKAAALPHAVLIAPGGKVLYRRSGAVDPLELRKAVVEYLGRTYK
jgi:thiol-disulfide isomerase/thioredoxin